MVKLDENVEARRHNLYVSWPNTRGTRTVVLVQVSDDTIFYRIRPRIVEGKKNVWILHYYYNIGDVESTVAFKL